MIENYVKNLADKYAAMTPQQRRAANLEVAGGIAGGIILNIAPIPFADLGAFVPYAYALYKAAPWGAHQIRSRLEGPRSLTISSNAEVRSLTARLRQTYQDLEVFRNSVYSEKDGTLVLDTGDSVSGVLSRVVSAIPGLRRVVVPRGSDPLETIEERFRSYLTAITVDVLQLAQIAQAKQGEIKTLEGKLREMREKKWGIAEIMHYMLERAPEVRQDENVMAFFTSGMEESLSPEVREERRQRLLTMLKDKLEIMGLGQLAMGGVAIHSREIYFRALMNYDAFAAIRPQLQAARDATLTAADTSKLSTSARDYLIALVGRIGDANKTLMEGLDIIDKTLVASPETAKALRDTVTDFYARLEKKGLVSGDAVKTIAEGTSQENGRTANDGTLDGRVIDA